MVVIENLLYEMSLACFVNHLDFSVETDQAAFVVGFDHFTKYFLELGSVIDVTQLIDLCNFRLEILLCLNEDLSAFQLIQLLILLQILIILWKFLEENLQGISCFLFFV